MTLTQYFQNYFPAWSSKYNNYITNDFVNVLLEIEKELSFLKLEKIPFVESLTLPPSKQKFIKFLDVYLNYCKFCGISHPDGFNPGRMNEAPCSEHKKRKLTDLQDELNDFIKWYCKQLCR